MENNSKKNTILESKNLNKDKFGQSDTNPLSNNPLSDNPLSDNPLSDNPLSDNPLSDNPLKKLYNPYSITTVEEDPPVENPLIGILNLFTGILNHIHILNKYETKIFNKGEKQ